MKKIKAFLLLILIAVLMLVTCKPIVSLGEQVDVKPPEGEISYPEIGANPIRGTFLIKGRASDDEQVSSVSVVFENQVTGFKTKPEDAKLSSLGGGNFEWQLEVKNELTEPEDEDVLVKPFNLLDGKYTARVTITDKSGKKIELIREYMIDNTPPVFIVSRPSTVIDADGKAAIFEQYGAELKIVGEAGELNELETLSLITANATIKKSNRERSINLVMTEFKEGEKNYYKTLYDAQNPALNYVEGNIYLEDNASLWNGNSEKTSGNISSFYYIKNAIEKDVLSKGYTAKVIHDYFAGQKGSESGTEHDILIYKLSKDEAAIASLKNNRVWVDRQSSTFNLDPDKTPGFKVIGYDTVTDASLEAPIVTYGNNTSLTFELHPNKDGTSLLEKVDLEGIKKSEIKISLYRGNDSNPIGSLKGEYKSFESTELFNVAAIEDLKGITISGIIKITTPIPVTLKPGYYRAALSGKDVVGNEGFVSLDAEGKKSGYSILKFELSAQEPVIYPDPIAEYHSKDFGIDGKIKNFPNGKAYYWLGKKDTPPASPAEIKIDPVEGNAKDKLFKIENIDISSLSDGKHTLTIKAIVESTGKESLHEVDFIVDKTAPNEAALKSGIPAIFYKWSQPFKGTASDKKIEEIQASGIERVSYKVGYKEDGVINYEKDESPTKLVKPAEGSNEYGWEAIVTFEKEKDNYVLVTVYDKAGNKTEKAFGPYEVDTKAPQIKVQNIGFSLGSTYTVPPSGEENAFKVEQNKVIGSNSNKIASFRILAKSAFGIKSVTVSLGGGDVKQGVNTNTDSDGYEVWDVNGVTLVEGNPNFKIIAESKENGLKTEWETNIVVDFTAPVITQKSPHLDGIYFNEVDLSGEITDKGLNNALPAGVDESTIEYKIANSGYGQKHMVGDQDFSKLEKSSSSWTVKIPNISKYKDVEGVTKPQGSSSIYTLPVTIRAKDKAGNISAEMTYNIKFDPAGGTPTITVVSPKANESIGGDVVISGSAAVANPASGKVVTSIVLQLRKHDGTFGTSWMVNGKNYGAGLEIKSDPNGINYWNHLLKDAERTAILDGAASKDVYFRVKGINAVEGDWSTERKFTISTDVAKFSEIKLQNGTEANSHDYSANSVWLKGDTYKITGKVMHNQGIKNDLRAASESVPAGVQALYTAGTSNGFEAAPTPVSAGSDSGYSFTVPVKTNQYTQKSGYIEFDIEATDGRTQNFQTVKYKVMLKYDNSKPAAVFGRAAGKFKRADFNAAGASGVSVNLEGTETISQAVARLEKKKDNLVLFAESKDGSAKAVKISSITVDASGNYASVTFAQTQTDVFENNADCILIEQNPIVFDKASADYQLEGFAYDTGSKMKSIRVMFGSTDKGTITRFEPVSGNFVSFTQAVETKTLTDGKYELKLTPRDDAGNVESTDNNGNTGDVYSCDVFLRNKPLKIKNVSFSTDLNGNGSYSNDPVSGLVETVTKAGKGSLDSIQNYSEDLDITKEFTLKKADKSQIKFDLDGGEGSERSYKIYKADSSWAVTGEAVKTGSLTAAGEINFVPADFADGKIPQGDDQPFVIELTDAASVSDTGRKLTLKVKFNVKTSDTRKPSVFIAPFYWNGEGDNSLASNDKTKGHIEIKKVSTEASLTGESDVSGAVVLRGTAYHPTKLTKLTLTAAGVGKTANFGTGTWSSADGLTVKDKRLDLNGHWVEWSYEWLTSDVGTKAVSVKAFHNAVVSGDSNAGTVTRKTAVTRSSNQSLQLASGDTAVPGQVMRIVDTVTSGSGSIDGDVSYLVTITSVEGDVVKWEHITVPVPFTDYYLYPVGYKTEAAHTNEPLFNKPVMSVNVVPYITNITTKLSELSSNASVYNRTALGRYPVSDKEEITIEGFNLGSATFKLEGTALTASGTKHKIGSAKSGELIATVGSIESINNKTDNKKPYNQEPNKVNNDLLTDDRFIDVWEFKQAAKPANGFISYPVLKVSPKDGSVGLAYANGVEYFNMAGFGNAAGQTDYKSARQFDKNWAQYVHTDFVFDEHGYTYGMATGVDMNSGEGVASYSKFVSRRYGTIDNLNNYGNRNGTQNGIGLRLENIGTTKTPYTADPDRIQSPSITTVAGNASNEETYIYLAYYDTINQHIRYRWGKVAKKDSAPYHQYGGQLIDLKGYGQMQEPPASSFSILAGPPAKKYPSDNGGSTQSGTANNSGKYVSLAAVKASTAGTTHDVVTAVWYNFRERSLMYAYTTGNPQTDNVTWSNPVKISSGGEYVRSIADPDGGIHVAFYDSGNLKYAYKPKGNSAPWSVVIVDSYSLTGTHVSIDLARAKVGGKWIPYISYYMQGGASAKLAYLVDETAPEGTGAGSIKAGAGTDEKFTGAWEVSIVPVTNVIREYRINVGVWKDAAGVIKAIPYKANSGSDGAGWVTGGNGTVNPILGYAVVEEGALETAQKK